MSYQSVFLRRLSGIIQRYPDRIAASDGERQITYGGLEEESARVYHALKSEGIGREDCVQIVMKRGVSFFPCIIGILKAGACFVALEEGYPPERIEWIRRDAACVRVIDDRAYRQIIAAADPLPGQEEPSAHDTAYYVYTSGSTGDPKGVIHEYGNLDQQAACFPEETDDPEFLQGFVPPFNFVAAVMQMIEYMVRGRTLVLIGRELLHDPQALLCFIREKKLKGIYLPPSYLRVLDLSGTGLKIIQTGSEPADGIFSPPEEMQIWNTYAMSESGFEVLRCLLDQPYDPAPAGTPVLDIDIYLADGDGKRVEGPGEGEICFRNEYVRGYLHLPEKTAGAFRDGCYHTGDLARRDEQGRYYIIGRMDDMIKINGNRVEPAEIEKQVKAVTGLKQAAAKGFKEGGRFFIVLYYLKSEAEAGKLLQSGKLPVDPGILSRVLPEYMFPAYYVGLDEFPLNPNGKLSRKELMPPDFRELPGRNCSVPGNETEQKICGLFSEILGIPDIGAKEDFFLLGGDSVSAVAFVEKCSEEGIRMDYRTLFECRTPEMLAKNWVPEADDRRMRLAEQEALNQSWPLLEGQLLHIEMQRYAPASPFLNVPMLWRLKPEVNLSRLKAAIERMTALHPVLNIRITENDGEWFQQYCDDDAPPVEIADITKEQLEEIRRIALFRLSGSGRLYCFRILRTEDAAFLYLNFHHANCDGTSLLLIRNQICRLVKEEEPVLPPDYYFEMVRQVTRRKRDPEAVSAALRRYEDIMGSSTRWQRKTVLLKKDMEGPAGGAGCISIPDFSGKAPGHDDPFYITAILRAMGSCNGTGEGMLWMISDGRNDKMLQDTAGFVARYIPVYLNPRNHSLRTVVRQIECLKAYPELEDTLYPMEGFFDMLHYNHVGRLEEQGEIGTLAESFEDLRVFDVAPGILSIVLADHPEDPGMDLYLYYSLNHYREESMNRFLERVCEELRLLEAEKRR